MHNRFTTTIELDFDDLDTAIELGFDELDEGSKLWASYKKHVELWAKAHSGHVKHVRNNYQLAEKGGKFRSN